MLVESKPSANYRRKVASILAGIVLIFATLSEVRAQNLRGRKAPASTAAVHDCGNGVSLRLTSSKAPEGGLLEVTVTSTSPLGEIKGDMASHQVPFWSDGERTRHGLVGIDLERAPGKYDLNVSVSEGKGGQQMTCSVAVNVEPGHFAIESLKVAPGFVELSPEDQARADREREHTHQIFVTITPERLWDGKFRMPLYGNRTGHNFGKRRVLNGKAESPHTGLDIPAPAGTLIHATQRGRVVLAENLFYSGNTVILDHGLGIYTFYGHMKSISVSEGEMVTAGTVLGHVGATGRATGPHLHWSLVIDGARVNPLGIVRLGSLVAAR